MDFGELYMRASLLRQEKSAEGVISTLKVEDTLICYIMEDPTKMIPVGIHECVEYPSPTYGKTYLVKVKGRTWILFHWGNIIADTDGCLLTGRKIGWMKVCASCFNRMIDVDGAFKCKKCGKDEAVSHRAVLESSNAFKDLKRALGSTKSFTLHVMELVA